MTMNKEELVIALLADLVERTKFDWLLTHQEGHFKCEVLNSLLNIGCTIQEGRPGSDKPPQADYGRMDGEKSRSLIWDTSDRQLVFEKGSIDAAIVEPFACMFELKTRSDKGTKAQAAHDELACDMDRITEDRRVVGVFVFDRNIYRSFSGDKTETRGRKSNTPEMASFFSKVEEVLDPKFELLQDSTWGSVNVKVRYAIQPFNGTHRVFVALYVP